MARVNRKTIVDLEKLVSRYCRFNQTPLTIEQYTRFGEAATPKTSYQFLRSEVPVRLAHIIQEVNLLPKRLTSTCSIREVYEMYLESFTDLVKYRDRDTSTATLDSFTKTLHEIKNKHSDAVNMMAEGIMELRAREGESAFAPTVQYFLNRFHMNRVGVRMLINQHLALFDEELSRSSQSRFIGLFDPNLNVKEVILDAADNASDLCDQHYFVSPKVNIRTHNKLSDSKDVLLAYVPSHLYHILFETFKNAMRATIEANGECEDELPAVDVDVFKSKEDLTIRISDQGVGIARSKMQNLFDYHYTTASAPDQNEHLTPFAGYGYGLPLSRIYAQYFGGDLELISVEGHGTHAYIYLKSMSTKAFEDVRTYSQAVEKTYSSLE